MRSATIDDIEGQVEALAQIVGREYLLTDRATLARLGRTTLPEGRSPAAVLRPASTAEVQRVVEWARRLRVPVYPISGGRNWGYGDACAPRDGCLLIDLSRMNRIIDVNVQLAYAVVEPGVTQGQLQRYLEENRLPLWMDATGAGPDASILGNILERGIGLSPQSDRFAHACAFEIVLADGRLLRTGPGSLPGARAEHLYKHGIGPALDGLFTQANLGIVTRLTFWLMPSPAAFCTFFVQVRKPDTVGPLMETMRRLRLAGTLRCSVHCFNALRLLGGVERYPWDRADGRQALEVQHPELVRDLLARHRIPAWVATGSLAGSRAGVRAARREVRRALRPLPDVTVNFLDRRTVSVFRRLRRCLGRLSWFEGVFRRFDRIAMWVDFLQGRTSHQTLGGAHWRARGQAGPDQDPRDSGAGLIWVCPVLPATGDAVAEVSRIGTECFHRFGFEYQATLSQVSDRALCAVMSIHYDRESPTETARAASCHDLLVTELLRQGYVPYRGAPRTVELLREPASVYWDVTRQVKRALDPQGLIAPGRYVPLPLASNGSLEPDDETVFLKHIARVHVETMKDTRWNGSVEAAIACGNDPTMREPSHAFDV